jgi:hypothetical protein
MGTERGRFSGRGPKGYTRSDDRIKEDVSERLEQHPEIDASEIEVSVAGGEVTLEGSVEDRRQKRMAEEAIENLTGVKDVHNRLKARQGFMANLFGSSDDDSRKNETRSGASGSSTGSRSGSSGSSTYGSTGSTGSSSADSSKK